MLLRDSINVYEPPLLKQLWARYERHCPSVLAVEPVPGGAVGGYRIIAGPEAEPGRYRCERRVEEPSLASAQGRREITGAYVLTREIYSAIARAKPGGNGEIQWTVALPLLAQEHPVYGATFPGTW